MADGSPGAVHISSAVVRALPDRAPAVAAAIDRMADVQVFGREGGKIVVVLEGPTSEAVGGRLGEIALIEGVVSASLVYEQIDIVEPMGEAS